jgi:hypothetical protein
MNSDWQFTSPVRSISKSEDNGFEKKTSLVNSVEQSKTASLAVWDKTPTTKVLCNTCFYNMCKSTQMLYAARLFLQILVCCAYTGVSFLRLRCASLVFELMTSLREANAVALDSGPSQEASLKLL